MKKKFLTMMLLVVMMFSIGAQQAMALTESQISAILGLLTAFDADQSVINNVNDSLRGRTPTISNETAATAVQRGVCIALSNSLYLGSRDDRTGGDVSKLQGFLRDKGHYTFGSITGYFGPVTERAVMSYQSGERLVSSGTPNTTGYGVIGPLTRKHIQIMSCGLGNDVRLPVLEPVTPTAVITGRVDVVPASGDAPLTAQIKASVRVPSDYSGNAIFFFGDKYGDRYKSTLVHRNSPGYFVDSWTYKYETPGTYEALLVLTSEQNVDADIGVMQSPYHTKNTIVGRARVNVSENGDSTTGILKMYQNGALIGSNLQFTLQRAMEICIANHKLKPTYSFRCTWNGEEIYNRGPIVVQSTPSITTISPLSGQTFTMGQTIPIKLKYSGAPKNSQVVVGVKFIEAIGPTVGGIGGSTWQSTILSSSGEIVYNKLTGPSYLTIPGVYEITAQMKQCVSDNCSYSNRAGTEVFASVDPIRVRIVEGEFLSTYRGYMDGRLFISTDSITRQAALQNCLLNQKNNPTKSIRCTWNGEEIYSRDGTSVVQATGDINQNYAILNPYSFKLTGSAFNTDKVIVYIVSSTYGGNTDWTTMGQLTKGGGGAVSNTTDVVNGEWSATFGGFSTGEYRMYVFNYSTSICTAGSGCSSNPNLIATSPLTVLPYEASKTWTFNSGQFVTENPILTGNGVPGGSLLITLYSQSTNKPVYSLGSNNRIIVDSSGKWSHKVATDLQGGSYRIEIFRFNVNTNTILGGVLLSSTFSISTSTSSLSPWGAKLVKSTTDIPEGKWRAYYLKTDTFSEVNSSRLMDTPYLNYGSGGNVLGFGGTFGSENLGAYWVGKFTFGNPSPPIVFDLSNPQRDEVRVYIDGVLAHTYGKNSGSPMFSRIFTGGTHTFEIEYDSNWHAGTFAARVGGVYSDYSTTEQVSGAISSLKEQYSDLRVVAASVYESGDREQGKVLVNIPSLTTPTVLVFTSYDPVYWEWHNNNLTTNTSQVKAVVLLSLAGAADASKVGNVPLYRVRNVYVGSSLDDTTIANIKTKIGQLNALTASYNPTSITLPSG